jgi:WbqC-like protein family
MIMDQVQLSDSAFQHRNTFLTADGKVKFLTIPFSKSNYLTREFRHIEIAGDEWQVKHRNAIWNTYRRHAHAAEIMPLVDSYFATKFNFLLEAVDASMRLSFECFGIKTQVMYQSAMNYDQSLRRADLVVALVTAAGADCYLSGTGAQSYLDQSSFSPEVSLRINSFQELSYPQKNIAEFVPGLSCLDALFNLGTQGARALLAAVPNKEAIK